MEAVTGLHRELKAEWEKTPPNLRKCGNLLDELKVFWSEILSISLRMMRMYQVMSLT